MRRWTSRELRTVSDRDFVLTLLNERKNSLTNPYAPLSRRLAATIAGLERATRITPDGNFDCHGGA